MRFLTLLSIFPFLVVLQAAPVPKELKQRPDAERMLGLWKFEIYNNGGREVKGTHWYFEKDKMYSGGQNTTDQKGTEYTIVLRPDKSPREMDIIFGQQITCSGIYYFDGDILHLAYLYGAQRPPDHSYGPGKSVIIMKRATAIQ